ncbi:hypothetical protein C3L33_02160, partial [Rhododendron williamsianum]
MMTENGVGPDLVTHNIVLSAFKSGAQYLKAVSYFQLMIGTDIRPDTTTHNIVIHCLIKLQQYAQAIEMFNSMREKRSECKPDIVTFTSLIHLYSVSGQIDHCKAVFNTMLGEGLKPNIVTYNSLIGAYASHGMSEEAQSIFSEMKKNGFRPDVVSYTSLLNAYGRSEQPKKAREVFHLMKRNNCKPNVRDISILLSLRLKLFNFDCRLRDWRTTTKLVKMMEPSFPIISVGVLNQLLLFIGKSGKIETMMMLNSENCDKFLPSSISFADFLKNSGNGWRNQCVHLFDCFEESFGCWKLEEIYRGNHIKLFNIFMQVLGWMEDAGIHPSFEMYRRILHFAQNGSGAEYAAVIQERVSKLSLGNF